AGRGALGLRRAADDRRGPERGRRQLPQEGRRARRADRRDPLGHRRVSVAQPDAGIRRYLWYMYAWLPRDLDAFDREADYQRQAAHATFRILRIAEPDALWSRIVADVAEWLGASAVRAFDTSGDDLVLRAAAGRDPLPSAAHRMERALAQRSLAHERSLISNHPRLDPDLAPLAVALSATNSVVHIL